MHKHSKVGNKFRDLGYVLQGAISHIVGECPQHCILVCLLNSIASFNAFLITSVILVAV